MHWTQTTLSNACIFLLGLTAIAQEPNHPPPGTQDPKAPSRSSDTRPSSAAPTSAAGIAGEQVLQGCIGSHNNRYVLNESRGETVPLLNTHDLAPYVGHAVALYGNFAAEDAGGVRPSNSGSTAAGNAEHSSPPFVVTKIDVVSEICSIDKRNPGAKPSSPKEK
jgi:hypothetical protein